MSKNQQYYKKYKKTKLLLQDRFVHVHSCTLTQTQMCMDTKITDTKTDVWRHTPTCCTHVLMSMQTSIQTQMRADKHEHMHTSGGVYLQQNTEVCFLQLFMETVVKDQKAHVQIAAPTNGARRDYPYIKRIIKH